MMQACSRRLITELVDVLHYRSVTGRIVACKRLVKSSVLQSRTAAMGSFKSTEASSEMPTTAKVTFSQEELKKRLTPMQYHVTQEKGTESAFSGELTYNKDTGIYSCIVCGSELFKSSHKFDSGSGWPSFYDVMHSEAVQKHGDHSHGMERIEVTCKKCGAHLGHVFSDGPQPTGERFCINSASLKFDPKDKSEL